jgi:predicted secreted acid phosphatase
MYKSISAILLSCFAISAFAKEPMNLDVYKHQLVQYKTSGEYERDLEAAIKPAKAFLVSQLHHPHRPLAIVLDIDETSLSNFDDMKKLSFGGTLKDIMDAEGRGDSTAIKPVLELYQFAKAHDVHIFFITGRTENYRSGTERNLSDVGFTDWDGLTLKPIHYHEKTAAYYKATERKKLVDQGYDIILNIGDQQSDFNGGYAHKNIKLPNPYYIVP